MSDFPPTLDGALERLEAVQPARYARSRNSLDGAVTRLSPYITHGFVTSAGVLSQILGRHALDIGHKFVYELGWREYFRHVWQRRGDAIFQSLHDGVLDDSAYAPELPSDIRAGRCGVPAIDRAVRELYATGYLHNHARMWVASYVVHIRRVSWRAGAAWMYSHLLDGDLASNHLSWQWVAGTASHKPYLFNADNVARYAPAAWHSYGTPVDATYEALDRLARAPEVRIDPPPSQTTGCDEPCTVGVPPVTPTALGLHDTPPDTQALRGRDVWLIHAWNLRAPPADVPADALIIGWFDPEFHRRWPWSERRWDFVTTRMAALTSWCWTASGEHAAALETARSVRTVADPHCPLAPLAPLANLQSTPAATLFAAVDAPCHSFSQWWTRATRGIRDARDLPGLAR